MIIDCEAKEQDDKKEILRVTWVGLIVNIALTAIKFICGILGGSQVVVADAAHSLSDLSTDLAIIIGVRFWTRPADKEHPHGHYKIETLVTLTIGLLLVLTASGILWDSLSSLHDDHPSSPTWVAFYATFSSILVKEALYQWTAYVGRKVKSEPVIANAWHHRSDAMSSIVSTLAVATAVINPSWWMVDHIGAIVVSFFIYQVAYKIVRPSTAKLLDIGVSKKDYNIIKEIVLDTDGVKNVHDIRTRYVGSTNIAIDLHIVVDGNITVLEGHSIYEMVKHKLLASELSIVDVVIHVDPFMEI